MLGVNRVYILLYLILITVIYISSFKENFTAEKIQKVTPALILVTVVIVLLCILSSFLSN